MFNLVLCLAAEMKSDFIRGLIILQETLSVQKLHVVGDVMQLISNA